MQSSGIFQREQPERLGPNSPLKSDWQFSFLLNGAVLGRARSHRRNRSFALMAMRNLLARLVLNILNYLWCYNFKKSLATFRTKGQSSHIKIQDKCRGESQAEVIILWALLFKVRSWNWMRQAGCLFKLQGPGSLPALIRWNLELGGWILIVTLPEFYTL